METLKGLPVANAINEKIIEEMKDWKGAIPHLAIVRVGERPDDMSYERGATKKMEKVGFRCTSYTFPADIDNDTFQKEFDKINEDEDIDGILLLRPLPKHLDEKAIENRIASVKDLDGISPMNLAKVYAGDPTGYGPCTAEAVIEMLDYAGVDGFHIRTLILTMIYRLMPKIIEAGKVYIAESPLYEVTCKDQTYFAYNEKEMDEIKAEIGDQKYTVQRSKGLGENEAEMMALTTMNPKTRRLIKVTPDDAQKTSEMFDLLLGDNLDGRKEYISDYGHLYLDAADVS